MLSNIFAILAPLLKGKIYACSCFSLYPPKLTFLWNRIMFVLVLILSSAAVPVSDTRQFNLNNQRLGRLTDIYLIFPKI